MSLIEIGKQAPAFTLPDQDGNAVKLTGLQGGPVVVYSYPKADMLPSGVSRCDC